MNDDLSKMTQAQKDAMQSHQAENRRINTEADILNFVAANGVDRAKFTEMFNSGATGQKAQRAAQLHIAARDDNLAALVGRTIGRKRRCDHNIATCTRIKDALDPAGTLSPGNHGIWPGSC